MILRRVIINNISPLVVKSIYYTDYFKDDTYSVLHRTDGPARMWKNGDIEWRFNGELHRVDGPALIVENGSVEEWFLHGTRHRVDGPAIHFCEILNDSWYLHGRRHRIGGPAVEWGGQKEWWVNGKRHRLDGPALQRGKMLAHGSPLQEWYLFGEKTSEKTVQELYAEILKHIEEKEIELLPQEVLLEFYNQNIKR